MLDLSIHHHKLIQDARGSLGYLEFPKQIPFISKRLFYIFGVPKNMERGGHAHQKCKQYLFVVKGQVTVTLKTKLKSNSILLSEPNKGIFIDNKIWCELTDFTKDSIIIVLASEEYDEKDYIRDWSQYVNYV